MFFVGIATAFSPSLEIDCFAINACQVQMHLMALIFFFNIVFFSLSFAQQWLLRIPITTLSSLKRETTDMPGDATSK